MLEFLLWWTVAHIIVFKVISIFRMIILRYRIKEKGYYIIKKPMLVRIAEGVQATFAVCIPIFGTFLVIVAILADDGKLIREGIKRGELKRSEI